MAARLQRTSPCSIKNQYPMYTAKMDQWHPSRTLRNKYRLRPHAYCNRSNLLGRRVVTPIRAIFKPSNPVEHTAMIAAPRRLEPSARLMDPSEHGQLSLFARSHRPADVFHSLASSTSTYGNMNTAGRRSSIESQTSKEASLSNSGSDIYMGNEDNASYQSLDQSSWTHGSTSEKASISTLNLNDDGQWKDDRESCGLDEPASPEWDWVILAEESVPTAHELSKAPKTTDGDLLETSTRQGPNVSIDSLYRDSSLDVTTS